MPIITIFWLFLAIPTFASDGTFTDPRDGKKYRTAKIGEQVWMAENLNYEVEGSKCYENDQANCNKYGRLYNWSIAMKVCPTGWHLPSNAEWDRLLHFVDDTSGTTSLYVSKAAGKELKARSGWNNFDGKSGNGADKFDFSTLPGGYGSSDGGFFHIGNVGIWWSNTESDAYFAFSRHMFHYREDVYWHVDIKLNLFSVRCLQD